MSEVTQNGELLLYGVIGDDFDGLDSKTFLTSLQQMGDVTVRINSGGGFVDEGIAIYNALLQHEGNVTVKVDAIAASMASVIAMAGDTVQMAENALLMIHNPWGLVIGDARDMRHEADVLDKMRESLVKAYQRHSGLDRERLIEMMDAETWLDAEEAIDAGLVEEIGDAAEEQAFRRVNLSMLQSIPEGLRAKRSGHQDQRDLSGRDWLRAASTYSLLGGRESGTSIKGGNAMADNRTPSPGSGTAPEQNADEAKRQALEAEKARRSEIREAFGDWRNTYPELLEQCLDDPDVTPDQARKALLDEMGKGIEPAASEPYDVRMGQDERDKFRQGAVNAVLARAGVEDAEAGNEMTGFGFHDYARACLERAGVRTARMSKEQLIKAAISHTTSDFPNIFEDAMHKTLLAEYRGAELVWNQLADTTDLADFRPHNRYRAGSFGRLKGVNEAGEIPHVSMPDAEREQIQASENGVIFTLSYQMLVDDDMGAFTSLARKLGRTAAISVERDVFDLLALNGGSGPVMSDDKELFSSDHDNLASSGDAPSVETLGKARQAMRSQKDPGGNSYIDIRPEILLTPLAVEDTAWQVVNSSADPSKTNSRAANREYNRWTVLSSPHLDDISTSAWYALARPSRAPAIQVGFLNGRREPMVETEEAFESRGIKYRVTHDYGVAAIDYRPIYRNPGK